MVKNSYIEYMNEGDDYANLSPKEYLNMMRPYLTDLIHDNKTPLKTYKVNKVINNESQFGERKIQLVMLNNCISCKNVKETRSIDLPSNNKEIFMISDTDDIIDNLFDTILQRFQEARETSNVRGSEFIHERFGLLYYYFYKIDIQRGESYIELPE